MSGGPTTSRVAGDRDRDRSSGPTIVDLPDGAVRADDADNRTITIEDSP